MWFSAPEKEGLARILSSSARMDSAEIPAAVAGGSISFELTSCSPGKAALAEPC
jgi:hypothetical protein